MGFLSDNCKMCLLSDEKIAESKPFYCGDSDLDDFFHNDVSVFQRNLMGKSYCFVLEEEANVIVAAFTVSNDSIRVYDLPRSRRDHMKHLTHKRLRRYPGVLVGRLAVSKMFAGRGIGSEILSFVKQWFIDSKNKTGCRFVVVDAVNDEGVLRFYQKNGFHFLFTSEEQESVYIGGEKGTPVQLNTRLMYFDLIELAER